ncbi:MAG: DNA translocase FtsK [Defluviitaleaceae bacterium]|nr:DNA translocase FtsK [Defluviitaleaceae bacterium]
MADKKAGAKKPVQNKKPVKKALRREIVVILLLFFAIFLVVSLLGVGGALGRGISALFMGLVGVGAFLLPLVLIAVAVLYIMSRQNEFLTRGKFLMGISLFLVIISFMQILTFGQPYDYTFGQYLAEAFLQGAWSNGGFIGAFISGIFVLVIGEIATHILFIVLMAILFIVITGKSIFAILRGGAETVRKGVEVGAEKRRDYLERKASQQAEGIEDDEDDFEHQTPYRYTPSTASSPYIPTISTADETHATETPICHNASEEASEPLLPLDTLINKSDNPSEPPHGTVGASIARPNPEYDTPTPQPQLTEEEFTIDIKGFVEGAENADDPIHPPDLAEQTAQAEDLPPWELESQPQPSGDKATPEAQEYVFPPVELLRENTYQPSISSRAQILENSKKLEETLASFGVQARVVEVSKGPTVTRYELSPGSGVKVSKIAGLSDDLALNLAAETIRVEAPIPGKSVVGIEIPNKEVQAVFLREIIDDDAFWSHPSKVAFAMGKDIAGNVVVSDIAKMPHLLIAGSTGSGKSVCTNTLITSIIYKATPQDVKLLMIDPKVVELSIYNGIPHLLIPVVTDPAKASGALAWAVREMESRYSAFAENKVRDLAGYNVNLIERGEENLPQIVIIIDELADLMMTCGKEVEESIVRLAQKARAAGIHLILATQRPSVDVITGLIKANVPSRLAFAVSSGTDSRTILDMVGAEKLLGKGDMLFSPVGMSKPRRIQGSFISDKEVENIVNFIKQDGETEYSEEMIDKITALPEEMDFSDESDPLIDDAIAFVVEKEKASTSMLQRKFRIGYNRAARMIEELEGRGLVGPEDGAKPRKVLMTPYQHREYVQRRQEAIDASIRSGSGDF